jgi:hypothetical protein
MAFRNEREMAKVVASRFPKSALEVKVGACIFDIVAYEGKNRIFKIIECKLGTHVTTIGHAFGQISVYTAVLSSFERQFMDAFTSKSPLRYERLMEATKDNTRLSVAFYVALTNGACRHLNVIRSLKHVLPNVGIIRVKDDGQCRSYLRDRGKADSKIAKATPVAINISLQPKA